MELKLPFARAPFIKPSASPAIYAMRVKVYTLVKRYEKCIMRFQTTVEEKHVYEFASILQGYPFVTPSGKFVYSEPVKAALMQAVNPNDVDVFAAIEQIKEGTVVEVVFVRKELNGQSS